MFTNNYCYFLNGVDGSELESVAYGQAVDAINSIPDVVADGSMEMVAGGRNGKVTCISGGLDAAVNHPPTVPIITGPTAGAVGASYDFTIVSTDPDGDDVYYYIDWDDETKGEWIGPYPSGVVVTVNHTWNETGTYYIRAKAKDVYGAESDWSDPYIITIVEDQPPGAPDIKGPPTGKPGIEYTYTFQSIDINGDNVYFYIEWGDESPAIEWAGPYHSGENASFTHTYGEQGTFIIKAKAKDVYELESDWSEYTVTMPRDRFLYNTFLLRILEKFSNALLIIRYILNL